MADGADAPRTLGRHRVEGVIGRSALATVHQAHDSASGRPVAVKLFRADLLEDQVRAGFVARVGQAVEDAGRCRHPDLAAIVDFGWHDGNPFVATELLRDPGPAEGIGRRRFGAVETVAFALPVLRALGHVHDRGLVHGGIKPANIRRREDGTVAVTDVGMAAALAGERAPTQPGAMIGPAGYLSPEQGRGDAVDGRSDLFSLGCLLYAMLAGANPFAGRSMTHVMARLLGEEPDDLAGRAPDLPPALGAAIHRALAKASDRRFPSAAAMAEALETSVRGLAPAAPGHSPSGDCDGPVPQSVSAGEIARLTEDLARYLGPIARILVRHAAPHARSAADLRQTLAANLDAAADREAFSRGG